jgi:hypothetical protein
MSPIKSVLVALSAVALASCATASNPADRPDGDPGAPDADPNRPDADPNAPDADPAAPDANPGSPDANSCTPGQANCSLANQTGCCSTEACDLDFSDLVGTQCRPVQTAGDEGDTCSSANRCAAGFVCIGNPATCTQYCDANSDCGQPRGQCVIQVTNGGAPIPGATLCSSNCDPVAATNPLCPTGWTCDLFVAEFPYVDGMNPNVDIVDCRPSGGVGEGGSCATADCASGLTCVNYGTSQLCREVCRPSVPTDCTNTLTHSCQNFTTPFTVGGQQYGICQPG